MKTFRGVGFKALDTGVLKLVVAGGLTVGTLFSCGPAPRRDLTGIEKMTDMYWVYAQFDENYAPLEYKEQRYGFKYDELKKSYLEKANATKSNEEFYHLVSRFVGEFKDAHTGMNLGVSNLPARAKVAYLGFSGSRRGNGLEVTGLLPSQQASRAFPIQVGDVVLQLDGEDLSTIVKRDIAPHRDLGNDESNLTAHMESVFGRVSTFLPLPAKENAELKISRGGQEKMVTLPWITQDLYAFRNEQKDASSGEMAANPDAVPFELGFSWGDSIRKKLTPALSMIRGSGEYKMWNTFRVINTRPVWGKNKNSKLWQQLMPDQSAPSSGMDVGQIRREILKNSRNVPQNAIFIDEAIWYPAYILPVTQMKAAEGTTAATKLVGYLFLDGFDTIFDDAESARQIRATIAKLQSYGVKDLVIDMIDNGGGSVTLGMQLAQALTSKKVIMPEIQFRLSETWLDEFETASHWADGASEREMYRRVFEGFKTQKAAGKRMSDRYNVEALLPFPIEPQAGQDDLNLVLLTNEMCASMCDIFSAMIKDNNMGKTVGSKTMGAGGNVAFHIVAPNSQVWLTQTESLILRKDGSYVENNGIDPDVALAVNESASSKYQPVLDAGFQQTFAK